jgi:hypothetical protein
VSFQRSYKGLWGSITHVIAGLENLLRKHNVPLAIIDGKSIAKLASFEAPCITKDDLINCISNIEQVKELLSSLQGTGDSQRYIACIRIQAAIRRYLQLKRYRNMVFQRKAVVTIQAQIRRFIIQQQIERHHHLFKAANQECWEGLCQGLRQDWPHIHTRARTIIHIPSISVEEFIRVSLDDIRALENTQLARVCDALDELVDVIFISPIALDDDTIGYNQRLFEVIGVKRFQSKVKFLLPEQISMLPPHLPLAQALWYSPQCLNRLRELTRGRTSFIVPGAYGWAEKRVAVYLGIPLLGADPALTTNLSLRSCSKQLFTEACMSVPPGAHDLYDLEDFLVGLTKLICCHTDVVRWLFKLDVNWNDEGVVILDTRKLESANRVKRIMHLVDDGDGSGRRALYSANMQLSMRKEVLIELQSKLAQKLQFVQPQYVQDWDTFLSLMKRYGAVIEADPPEQLGEVCACLLLPPAGSRVHLFNADVVRDAASGVAAFLWPQTFSFEDALTGASHAIANALVKHKCIGFVTLFFVSFWDSSVQMPRLWATRLQFGFGAHMSAFNFFCASSYRAESLSEGITCSYSTPWQPAQGTAR